VPRDAWYPDAAQGRAFLAGRVADQLALLRATEARVRADRDEPERDRVLDLALTLSDETEARLFFRYRGESRTTFHRAYRELVGALKREEESDSRNEQS
jgi:hypothetical protein